MQGINGEKKSSLITPHYCEKMWI